MQPPPRKGKVTTLLKNAHNEQLVKLQMKHQQDSDFLDDIRNFTKMRAVIEKDYAQALLKLATSHLQKKAPLVPDGKSEDGESYKTVYTVWKTMLDETEKIAKARLAATEVYQQQVSESAKSLRLHKLQVAKKCFENLKKMHEEIQICVVEIDKTKKLYFEEEHMAHEAREKAHDADEKLRRKKGRIFQSISSLQKNSAKFSFRREACDIQATKARNDYVLALLAANAHQFKYYEVDLPEIVQYIDCDIYDKVKEYILLIARTELLTCAACQSSFSIVQDQANMATKQYTMECFFRDNPVLSQPILYEFEPCDGDQINKLSIEHNAALCLSKEARRWASCVTKEVRVTRDSKAELKKLLAQIGDKPPYALQSDQIGPQAELEARIDELRQIIRKSQTSKKKAEARLEAMKEAGVNIEEWCRTSESESVSASESPIPEQFSRSGTVTSRSSRQSYQPEVLEGSIEVNDDTFYDSDTGPEPTNASVDVPKEEVYMPDLTSAVDVVAAVQEAWDAAAETEEIEEAEAMEPVVEQQPSAVKEVVVNGEVPAPVPDQRCVALFSYDATNSDELSFVEQEELELIGEGDGDGWVMARNYRGEEGYIPQNYVEVIEIHSTETSSRPPLTSFSSVDYSMPSEDKTAGIIVEEQVSAPVTSMPPAPVTSVPPAPITSVPVTSVPPAPITSVPVTSVPPAPITSVPVTSVPPAPITSVPVTPVPPATITSVPVTPVPPATITSVPPAPITSVPVTPVPHADVERPTDLPTTEHYPGIFCCQAVYDYEATCNEELSFFEGQIIRILRKTVCDVDDGWWEGELDGKIGLFPSLVVEELKENGEPLTPMTPLSPPGAPPPPAFTPPEAQLIIPPAQIVLTQPTPEIEHPDSSQQKPVAINMDEDFHIELNKKQQRQYQEQFSTSDTESSEHEAPAAQDVGNYAPLVSSPDSPTKSMAASVKNGTTESAIEEINSEITTSSQGTDDCPTVVVTTITAGDTPTSDDDIEFKEEPAEEKEEPAEEKEEPAEEKEEPAEEKEEPAKEKEEPAKEKEEPAKEKEEPAKEKEILVTEKEPLEGKELLSKQNERQPKENGDSESTYRSADEFECTFPDVGSEDTSQKVPSSSVAVTDLSKQNLATESQSDFADFEKMEVNGVETSKNFNDSQNAETTG